VPPKAVATNIERIWKADLLAGVSADPAASFANPSRATLASSLAIAARRYHFKVVRVEVTHPLQAAPIVVIATRDRQAISRATPAILRLIDPKAKTGDDATGWAYEGFLFEALDQRGVPFLITRNFWRGPHAGGGQWASSPSLYPSDHG
jgi:hypothetical protein